MLLVLFLHFTYTWIEQMETVDRYKHKQHTNHFITLILSQIELCTYVQTWIQTFMQGCSPFVHTHFWRHQHRHLHRYKTISMKSPLNRHKHACIISLCGFELKQIGKTKICFSNVIFIYHYEYGRKRCYDIKKEVFFTKDNSYVIVIYIWPFFQFSGESNLLILRSIIICT